MNMKLAAKVLAKVGVIGFVGFAATFTIYFFNLENKLIYYVVRPLLHLFVWRVSTVTTKQRFSTWG